MAETGISTHILYTWQDIKDFRAYVESQEFSVIAMDVETDSAVEHEALVYGIGVCFESHQAFYIPIINQVGVSPWSIEEVQKITTWLSELFKSKKLIGHNIIFDVLVWEQNFAIDLSPYIYSDTILQKHVVDEERPFGLKEVAVKYLGKWADKAQKALYDSIEANGGSTTQTNMEMYKADTDILGEYCAYDTILTFRLFHLFEERIKQENLRTLFYDEEIMPLYREVTIPMRKKGFRVNVPYFQILNMSLIQDLGGLEATLYSELQPKLQKFEDAVLAKDYPPKPKGLFPKYYAEVINFKLPTTELGKITLTKKTIATLSPDTVEQGEFVAWLKGDIEYLNPERVGQAQRAWNRDLEGTDRVFNFKSNNHLKWLFFEEYGFSPLSHTEKGEPQVDDDFLETIKSQCSWVSTLIEYKKLLKIKSTYVEGLLESEYEGTIYPSWIQFGPPSGRYACRGYNLQNLPRVKDEDAGLSPLVLKYVNAIKRGFIAPEGHKIVNADYSQLEPCAFSEACGDEKLQDVFRNKQDLYSAIAINIWGLFDASADKKADNYLKTLYPEHRQKAKVIALAIVYGSEAGRVAKLLDVEYTEAQDIIDNYLNAYPGLKDYINKCRVDVCTQGYVRTKYGRIRHLPEAKRLYKYHGFKLLDRRWAKQKGLEELSWQFKNMLNLSQNFPIQGVAAHIVNRAAIAMNRKFKELGLDAQIIAQVHDELTCIAKEEQAEQVRLVMKDCMENTTKIAVPLSADPIIGDNWAESK